MVAVTPDESPARLLAIAAHPDDIDFGLGGTVAQLAAAGTEVTYCVITDGDAGGFDPEVPRSDIPRIRRATAMQPELSSAGLQAFPAAAEPAPAYMAVEE